MSDEQSEMSYITGKSIGKTYEKLSLHEKILHSPDTYVGSVETGTEDLWVYDSENQKMTLRETTFVEAFFKIFDEVLVNAIDQSRRLESIQEQKPDQKINLVKNIRVTINRETGWISVENDGEGMDVEKHPDYQVYVPELLFGQTLTSTNYDKTEERTVGGKNGYGAKLANIYSREFHIETVDSSRGRKYHQIYRDNMFTREEPEIENYSKTKKPFTRISFLPDFEKFGIEQPQQAQDWDLLERRVIDTGACTSKNVNVFLNDQKIKTKSFRDYVGLYLDKETPRVYFNPNDRWEICLTLCPEGIGKHVSFVNGIFTDLGGTHVDHVLDTVSKKLLEEINSRKSKNNKLNLPIAQIKRNLQVFVKSVIVNPNFDGQTKRRLTTQVSKFGSRCFPAKPNKEEREKIDETIKEIVKKLGIEKRAKQLNDFINSEISDKDQGKQQKTINVPKLEDAEYAGGVKSQECTLILIEGDSAKTAAKNGLSVLPSDERKRYGIFPLKGKLLNVRETTKKKAAENDEVKNIVKILGLKYNTDYSDENNFKKLRYGRVMILTDADFDGEHIKGLIMNFLHFYWPSLLMKYGFVCGMITPIIKARRYQGKKVVETINFYSEREFYLWTQEDPKRTKKYTIQYYKGLGGSDNRESKEWFQVMKITYYYWNEETQQVEQYSDKVFNQNSDQAIELAFSKSLADDRKEWLRKYNEKMKDISPEEEIPPFREEESFSQFINDRFINFSNYDVIRSIPNICDGFKPSHRKVFYTIIQKNLKKLVKVAQLSGAVSELANYHHGETSIQGTIIGLARNYTGSNNINLLEPAGQFGSRQQNGKDFASPRYIFTRLEDISCSLFRNEDLAVLEKQFEEGDEIEPKYYVPVLPMVLINGSSGIGTGFSCNISNYNPQDIINNLRLMLNGQEPKPMKPWFRGFKGSVEPESDGNGYTVRGEWSFGKDTEQFIVTEIPVGNNQCKSLEGYYDFLESLKSSGRRQTKNDDEQSVDSSTNQKNLSKRIKEEGLVKNFKAEIDNQYNFKFTINLNPDIASDLSEADLEKKLALRTRISTSNMYLFNHLGEIKLYQDELEVLKEFYQIRLNYYQKRRDYLLAKKEHELTIAKNKRRFISENAEGKISLYKKDREESYQILVNNNYQEMAPWESNQEPNFNYLLNIRIGDFSQNKLDVLENEINKLEEEIQDLKESSLETLWSRDLDQVEEAYKQHLKDWEESQIEDPDSVKKNKKSSKNK